MSTSRLPTELTNLGPTTTTLPTDRIGLVPLFLETTQSYWLWVPPGPQLSGDSLELSRKIYRTALEHAEGAAPSTRGEWEDHLRWACETTEYESLRASLIDPGRAVVKSGRALVSWDEADRRRKAVRTAWITVNKDKDNGIVSFRRSLPEEIQSYNEEAQTQLTVLWEKILQRFAVLPGSATETQWRILQDYARARREPVDELVADLDWVKGRVKYAAERVLWDEGILDTLVETHTTHATPTYQTESTTVLPKPKSHQPIMQYTWVQYHPS